MVGDVGNTIVAVKRAELFHLHITDKKVVNQGTRFLAVGVVRVHVTGALRQLAGGFQVYIVETLENFVLDGGVHITAHNNGNIVSY